MYIPAWHREENPAVLHALMREYAFATLVTTHDNAPFATHLPVLLDGDKGALGTLNAHIARANPQWHDFESGQEALAIFQGPHAYISPAWYDAPLSVPTWNYAVVHAYGVPRLLDDDALYRTLARLVETFESPREAPWPFDLPDDFTQKMMRGIVGFEIEITRLEGKLKLSQNRSETDQNRVIAALRQTEDPLNIATAAWMEKTQ